MLILKNVDYLKCRLFEIGIYKAINKTNIFNHRNQLNFEELKKLGIVFKRKGTRLYNGLEIPRDEVEKILLILSGDIGNF